jgi:hypothetical protein
MDKAEIEEILLQALHALYAADLQILRLDVAERTICAQLAQHLQRSFPNHRVHTEYNRHGIDPKEIDLPDADGNLTSHRVYPDIIVHQPSHDQQNILVIEAKKALTSWLTTTTWPSFLKLKCSCLTSMQFFYGFPPDQMQTLQTRV